MFFPFFLLFTQLLPPPTKDCVCTPALKWDPKDSLFEKFGQYFFFASAQNKIVYSSKKSPPDGIFCLSFAIWVLATSYTWTNLSRLCQFKIWLVPKRYKKTAGTDVTWCVTGIQVPRYLGYLGTSRYLQVPGGYLQVLMGRLSCDTTRHFGKSSDLVRLPHIWFYVYHVICNCL